MNRIIIIIFIYFSHSVCWSNQISTLDKTNLPPEFNAVYDVHKSNFRVGEMHVSLKIINDEIIYTSTTNPIGIAAFILGDQQFYDFAKLKLINKRYRIVEFKHEMKGSEKNRNEHYFFDWKKNKATGLYKDREINLDISPYTFDSFSSQLLLMRKPKQGINEFIYSVVSKGRLKEYTYKLESNEKMETKIGALMAHKFVREKQDKEKTKYIGWYAQELNYIPIKLDKIENGNTDISIRIKQINWI